MVYRPVFRKQGDGSRCAWENCGPASHAMASQRDHKGIDPNTPGPWPPLPPAIRNKINLFCPGTSLEQNRAACLALYNTNMLIRYALPWSSFISLLLAGHGAVVSISYAVIAPTVFDGSPGFTGRHSIYVNEVRTSDGAFLVYDPLADHRRAGIPQGPQWWPGHLLKAAAGAYPGAGYGYVTSSYTRATT